MMQPSTQIDLSPTEWRAVAIALDDAAREGADAPFWQGALRRFFLRLSGSIPANRLADPRLEVIRTFVHEVRRRRRIEPHLVDLLALRGFNQRQIEALALLSQ